MIFFVCLINVAFFGSLEIVTRFILWGVSSDHYALLYWFDSDIRILVSDLSTMEITFHKEGEIDSKLSPNNDVLLNPFINAGIQGKKLVVWAFGGSTTAGYNCSTKASSWPEELQKIRRDFTVINHGRNGADSDFSILRLKGPRSPPAAAPSPRRVPRPTARARAPRRASSRISGVGDRRQSDRDGSSSLEDGPRRHVGVPSRR